MSETENNGLVYNCNLHANPLCSPPVIPYMGLVLQDLTFVHIGNSDYVKDKVNFAKRWQQYNILVRTTKQHK